MNKIKLTGVLLMLVLTQSAFAQIKIESYRWKEQQNYVRESRNSTQQLERNKSQFVNNNEIQFDLDVLMNVEATSYAAVYNVRQVAENVVKVNELMDKRINNFIAALLDKGVKRTDITVDLISQSPIYGLEKDRRLFSTSFNEVPIGFEIEKNVIIRYTDYESINWIASTAAGFEIYDLVKVDHFADVTQNYLDSMRKAAISCLEGYLKDLEQIGLKMDTMKKVMTETNTAIYPITRYHKYNPLSKPAYNSLLEGSSASTVETIPSPSLYYNHFSFENFDVILHPEVTSPAIQYTLNMKVKFMDYPKPAPAKREIYYLTPDGRMQLLQVK